MSNSSVRARGFEKAEASLRLEGMDPSGPLYEGIKQRIIAGEITYEQGRAEIFEYHAQRAKQHQA
ncbi:antitoxin VbhA family protein [Escherichia coli]|uniref:antitoxin VbhA family protein n=1 Tax=Escherichia coli TaxID=562 RepID=UPI00196957FB|nr:antitoxin VbhA family protein [Escherichia coli]QSC93548.1 antitoxin VbhA family protein [Escherichia coli]